MRLLIDLQAGQTSGSAHRGVGRYSTALVNAVAAACAPRDLRVLTSKLLPHESVGVHVSKNRFIALPSLPDWQVKRDFSGGDRDTLDSIAYTSVIQRWKPDVVHVSHVFEGLGDRVPLPDPNSRAPGQVFSATLYDLIPLVFQDHYFKLPGLKAWYYARMKWIRQADLLLAISESTRQDAINLLGLEPWRVVTIHGGVGEQFQPPVDPKASLRQLKSRYGVRDQFVLYTGGDDFRKNVEGAIEGFAAVAPKLRANRQLVIVCSMPDERKRHFLNAALSHGLKEDQILITGFVPESDLVSFYGACELFLFPSLYEGLGLPILEAMACGAPAIGGDNSSIREIISREDALFDAKSATSIAECITRVLADPAHATDLRRQGLSRVRDFTWSSTGSRAIAAFDEALLRARTEGTRIAVHGWLSRKRLAVLSPLPPLRTGIADYTAGFLPHLARHFDIDLYVDGYVVESDELNASFRIFDTADFERAASSYDAILYEFGNSEFHVNMLRLIERFPGVVGLHDGYLSGLYRYVAMIHHQPSEYHAAMLTAHGPRARRILAPAFGNPDPDEAAMIELPCTKAVIDMATGLISHSPFNLALARENFPQGWCAPYRTIPQVVACPPATSPTHRAKVRAKLGFNERDFVVVSFGHVAWTKWGDRMLQAFLVSDLRDVDSVHLVFAGELSKDEFGASLQRAVDAARLKKRIRVTGYLTDDGYQEYLQIADLAVQLRTKSRGGTPKGVLDCLAHSVPVIVNNDASYVDYPPSVVIKLSASPTIEEIADVLQRAHRDSAWLASYAQAGLQYVSSHHSPSACAAEYAAAIEEFTSRQRLASSSYWIDAMAPRLAACPDVEAAIACGAQWLDNRPVPRFERRRIFVDVSHIAQSDHQTGVPRVVRETVRNLYGSSRGGLEPIAVELVDGKLQVANSWLTTQGLRLPQESSDDDQAVEFQAGDVLLMLDSSWARYTEFYPAFEGARAAGATIITAIYDLLPLTLPPGNIVDGGAEWFGRWLKSAVESSDGLVCISRAVADELAGHIERNDLGHAGLKVGFWHLGADFAPVSQESECSSEVADLASHRYLLMIGTIEPRKSHALALNACEEMWNRNIDLHLVIAGKKGWLVDQLMETLRAHPQRGKRLHLLESPTDHDIEALYRHASGLLFISKGEGFGLPLVEAANHGVPIICSDLPVFREIAGDVATYVRMQDATVLAEELTSWLRRFEGKRLPDTRSMQRLTWAQSTEKLLEIIVDDTWVWAGHQQPRQEIL